MFPTLDETTSVFEGAGFEVVGFDEVEFEVASSVAAHLERLRHRAISTFELLTDQEVEEGLAAMERAAAVAGDARAVPIGISRWRGSGAQVTCRVMPDRVVGAFPQDLATKLGEVAFEVSTPQAAAR